MNYKKRLNIGDKLGHLTIVQYLGVKDGYTTWKLKCDCGTEIERTEVYLLSAKPKVCGHGCMYMHDLTGKVFYNWTVIEPKKFESQPRTRWLCKCKCGNESYIDSHTLTKGLSKSCGCLGVQNKKKFRYPTNKTLTAMKSRCYNETNVRYKQYGGRGIKVCDEWLDVKNGFKNFYEWSLQNGWKEGLTIERIDINKGYCPENCKWIPLFEQASNTSRNRFITYNGKTLTLSQWARELGISVKNLSNRIYKGWSIEKAFNTPIKKIK